MTIFHQGAEIVTDIVTEIVTEAEERRILLRIAQASWLSKLLSTSPSPSAPTPAGWPTTLPPARTGTAGRSQRAGAKSRRDAGPGALRVGGAIDAVHELGSGGPPQDQGRAARQQRDLVGRQPVAHVGADGAGAEVHRPVGRERQRHDDGPEGSVIGVHADPLAGPVLVDDALFGPPAVEERRKSVRDELSPARECGRRGVWGVARRTVVVPVAVVLNAAAEVGDYAMRRLGQKRVDQITTADVMAVLIPHWHTKSETMQRVRQRIGTVMKWAVAQGYRGDNPAGDAISAALPKNGSVRRHQRALPFGEVSAALHRVKRSGAFEPTVLAFEFLVLTACRSGEVRLATWDEIDFDTATWTVPANRMKSKRDHRVPLSARTQGVLQEAREFVDSSGLVFPSPRGGAISANTISKLLRELDIDAVPHGFCSSFRDWAAECSDATREVCELALAHVNSDRVEAAYRRTDLFEQRRVLMEQWSGFVGRSAEGGEDHARRSVSHPTHR